MRILITIIVIILFGCQNQQNSKNKEQASDIKITDSVLTDELSVIEVDTSELNQEQEPNSKKSELPLGLSILKDFEQNSSERSVKENDSLFIEFLKSFTTYQDNMNDLLFDDPNYDTYNTLIYADENLVKPMAKEFEDSVRDMGFYVSMSEGMIFLEKDPQFLSKFSEYLSERMNTFRIQYSKEIEYPLAEDGGIIISSGELIQRVLFWEKFRDENSDFELPDYSNDQFEMHLFYLMFGMDNTPIHDWSDSLKIRPEVIENYRLIIERYQNSKAAEYLNDYLNYLEQKNYKYDRSFNEYGKEKFPTMYGN